MRAHSPAAAPSKDNVVGRLPHPYTHSFRSTRFKWIICVTFLFYFALAAAAPPISFTTHFYEDHIFLYIYMKLSLRCGIYFRRRYFFIYSLAITRAAAARLLYKNEWTCSWAAAEITRPFMPRRRTNKGILSVDVYVVCGWADGWVYKIYCQIFIPFHIARTNLERLYFAYFIVVGSWRSSGCKIQWPPSAPRKTWYDNGKSTHKMFVYLCVCVCVFDSFLCMYLVRRLINIFPGVCLAAPPPYYIVRGFLSECVRVFLVRVRRRRIDGKRAWYGKYLRNQPSAQNWYIWHKFALTNSEAAYLFN